MKNNKAEKLYKQYFVDKNDERRELFEKINNLYKPERGIYPGSFVHITASFYIKDMTYIDSDKRINAFFKDPGLLQFVEENKIYSEDVKIEGFQSDYGKSLPIEEESFDVMFSFYAGFISQSCKKYLKDGAVLICNNSHGDSSLAYTDCDYKLIGVIKRNGSRFSISDKNLSQFFKKADGSDINREKILKRMIGENFSKKCFAYIFQLKREEK